MIGLPEEREAGTSRLHKPREHSRLQSNVRRQQRNTAHRADLHRQEYGPSTSTSLPPTLKNALPQRLKERRLFHGQRHVFLLRQRNLYIFRSLPPI